MVEEGLSFTVIESPHPFDGASSAFDARGELLSARRVWLGPVFGTDWLHEAIEAEMAESGGMYEVFSRRDSSYVGAASEVAQVLLVLLGAGATGFVAKLGARTADDLYDWVRERIQRHQPVIAPGNGPDVDPPDFFERELEDLTEGMRAELAQCISVPEERLEVLSADRTEKIALSGVYRDTATGNEYSAETGRHSATFKRLARPQPRPGVPDEGGSPHTNRP